jgi:hypothetical protein
MTSLGLPGLFKSTSHPTQTRFANQVFPSLNGHSVSLNIYSSSIWATEVLRSGTWPPPVLRITATDSVRLNGGVAAAEVHHVPVLAHGVFPLIS